LTALRDLEELRNPGLADNRSLFGGRSLFGNPHAESVVFLHGRRAGGPEKIVIIRCGWYPGTLPVNPGSPGTVTLGTPDYVSFSADVTSPASLTGLPEKLKGQLRGTCGVRAASPGSFIRLFAGQPDTRDASRFTIDFETSDGRGTIEGKLCSDDRIEMHVISGPASAGQ
jgi:hypothetical protein